MRQSNDHAWKRTIALFFIGQSLSLFGSSIVQFAVMWYLTLETGSGIVITFYALAAFLPQALVSLFGGTLADRVNRKALIIIPDAIIALTTLILALIMMNGVTDLWIILLAVAIRSFGAGLQTPAVNAAIPSLVPASELMRVNGINSSVQGGIAVLSPAVGGLVYGLGGIVPTFFIDVVTALLGIVMMFSLVIPSADRSLEGHSFISDLVGGVRYTATHRFIRWLFTVYAVIFVLVVAPNFLVPLMVKQKFGDAVWQLTVVEVSFSVGMILGGAVVAFFFMKHSKMHLLLWTSILFGLSATLMAFVPSVYAVFVLNFIVGVMVPVFSTPSTTMLQEQTDPEYMGRVFSLVSLVFTLGMPFGMVFFGPLAEATSVEVVLVGTGLTTVLFVLVSFFILPDGRAAMALSVQQAHQNRHSGEAETPATVTDDEPVTQ